MLIYCERKPVVPAEACLLTPPQGSTPVVNSSSPITGIRRVAKHLMTRAGLEVAYFACSNREAFITNTYNIYLPCILFNDDFRGHRNNCRLLKAFYSIARLSAMENGGG